MPRIMKLMCSNCYNEFLKETNEYMRQVRKGREHFFCSLRCGAIYKNRERGHKKKVILKMCPCCKHIFVTDTSANKTYCTGSCASKSSMTEKRIAGNRKGGYTSYYNSNKFSRLKMTAKGLRKREWKKYELLDKKLTNLNINHQFEFPIDDIGVIDLFLSDYDLLIEFDSSYHSGKQKVKDEIRDEKLVKLGYRVIRIETLSDGIIDLDIDSISEISHI